MIWIFFVLYLVVACATTTYITYMCYVGDIKWIEAERDDLLMCLVAGIFWPLTWPVLIFLKLSGVKYG